MSSTEDMRSPYVASNPPGEKSTWSTISGLMMLSPSCWPLRMSCGRYTSTPLMYTRFSSNEPPRTEYCEESSLLELTSGRVFSSASTPEVGPTVFSMRCMLSWVNADERMRSSVTSTTSNCVAERRSWMSSVRTSPFPSNSRTSCGS